MPKLAQRARLSANVRVAALCLLGQTLANPTSDTLAQTIIYQQTIQGGISIDASGADAISNPGWSAGPNLVVQIPAGAVVTTAYLIVRAKYSGFDPAVNVRAHIELNGVLLTSGVLMHSGVAERVYLLNPATFGINGAGSYSYRELFPVDTAFYSGYGVGGSALVVIYTHATLPGTRHIVVALDHFFNGTRNFQNFPTSGTTGQAILSVGIDWECAEEQSVAVSLDGVLLSNTAGGSDDGPAFDGNCTIQGYNALITQGSFGFDDNDALVGTDGDSPFAEPGCCASNSRMSDELWAAGYDESGNIPVTVVGSTSMWVSTIVLAVEMETSTEVPPASPLAPTLEAYPNPFNPATTLRYTVPMHGQVAITIYDLRGAYVATLVDHTMDAGAYAVEWNGRDDRGNPAGSGVYFARLSTAAGSRSYKMTLLK